MAECPKCHREIISCVAKRTGKMQLPALHFPCGEWYRAKGKKGQEGFIPSKLPGTWTLSPSDTTPGEFYTMGKHLAPLGLRDDEPLVFAVRDRRSL